MAKLKRVNITENDGGAGTSGQDTYDQQLAIFNYSSTVGSPNYVHFKTNITLDRRSIVTIEAVGYNYGNSLPIRCSWSFYTPNNGQVQNLGIHTVSGTGLSANSIYVSNDGYVCISGYANSFYFCGIVLNAYTSGATGGTGMSYGDIIHITDSTRTDSPTGGF